MALFGPKIVNATRVCGLLVSHVVINAPEESCMSTSKDSETRGDIPSLTVRVKATCVSDSTSPETSNFVERAPSFLISISRDAAPLCVHLYVSSSPASGSEAVPVSLPTEPSYTSVDPPAVTIGGVLA